MKNIFSCCLVAIVAVLASGCGSNSEKPLVLGYQSDVLDSSDSQLVIYREPIYEVSKRSPHLFINNKSHGRLKDNRYMVVPTDPGQYFLVIKKYESLSSEWGEDDWPVRPKTLKVGIEAGQEKFIRYTVRANDSVFDWYDAVFEEVSREQAMKDLDFMARQEAMQ